MTRLVQSWRTWLAGLACISCMLLAPESTQAQSTSEWSPRRSSPSTVQRPSYAPATRTHTESQFTPEWQRNPRERAGTVVRPVAYQEPMAEIMPAPAGRPTPIQSDDVFGPDTQYFEGDAGFDPEFSSQHFGSPYASPAGPADCGECNGGGHCGSCDGCGHRGCWLCIPICGPCGLFGFIHESYVFGGAHAFKGPVDQGRNGNFGFHEGVNFAGCAFETLGVGYQIGANFVHSNFRGDQVDGAFRDSSRDQTFITAGLFHRAWDGYGWQFGAVYDYLDDSYYETIQLSQVRAELSHIFGNGHEFGFWGAFGTNNATSELDPTIEYRPTDMYTFFYRRTLGNGGQARVWAGGTGDRDGILGADFRVPLSNRIEMTGGFNYLIPNEGRGEAGGQWEESWGLSMQLVWYPGRGPKGIHNTPYRALFNVADNNVYFVDRVQP